MLTESEKLDVIGATALWSTKPLVAQKWIFTWTMKAINTCIKKPKKKRKRVGQLVTPTWLQSEVFPMFFTKIWRILEKLAVEAKVKEPNLLELIVNNRMAADTMTMERYLQLWSNREVFQDWAYRSEEEWLIDLSDFEHKTRAQCDSFLDRSPEEQKVLDDAKAANDEKEGDGTKKGDNGGNGTKNGGGPPPPSSEKVPPPPDDNTPPPPGDNTPPAPPGEKVPPPPGHNPPPAPPAPKEIKGTFPPGSQELEGEQAFNRSRMVFYLIRVRW